MASESKNAKPLAAVVDLNGLGAEIKPKFTAGSVERTHCTVPVPPLAEVQAENAAAELKVSVQKVWVDAVWKLRAAKSRSANWRSGSFFNIGGKIV